MTTLKSTFKYKHESKSEMMAFLDGHLMAVALTHTDKDVLKAFEGKIHDEFDGADAAAKKASQSNANKQLFGLLIQMIDNDELVTTLATQLSGKGKECIDFIRSSWDDGDQDDRYTSANDDYLRVLTTPLLESTTAEEFLAKCNEMHLSRTILAGSHRAITDAAHADNVVDMVKKITPNFGLTYDTSSARSASRVQTTVRMSQSCKRRWQASSAATRPSRRTLPSLSS